MRVDLKKILFIGSASLQHEFLLACQQQGNIQFFGSKISTPELLQNDFNDVLHAIKILQQFDVEQTSHVTVVDPLSLSRMVITDKLKLEEATFALKVAKEKLEMISPFGTIPIDDIRFIESQTQLSFRLFSAPAKKHAANTCQDLIELFTLNNKQYFFSLSNSQISLQGLEEIPLTQEMLHISQTIQDLTQKIEDLEDHLKHRAAFVISLKRALLDELDTTKRVRVLEKALFPLENKLFSLSGWVPETQVDKVHSIAASLNILSEEVPILSGESPPTCLENKNISQVGSDLVAIYDTPSNTDADPSIWVLIFFSIFFAMIMCDGGYGLIFLLSAFIMQKKISHKSYASKSFIKLVTILGISCVGWGFVTNSFFGIELSESNPLRTYSPLTYLVEKQAQYHLSHNDELVRRWTELHGSSPTSIQEFLYESPTPTYPPAYKKMADTTFMEISLLIGAIHIILSILRYLSRNFFNVSWLFLIVGGYLYCANYLHATSFLYYLLNLDPSKSANIGLQLVATGTVLALLLSFYKHGIVGLFEITGAIQVFADVVSYLRIYALALSGAMIAGMANQVASKLPFILAAITLIIAHAVNIVLSIMGGVIHGLRLNFLEWYHYSFEGGGKPFSPLKLEER